MKSFLFTISFFILPTLSIAQNLTLDTISINKRMLSADLNFQGKDLSLMKLEELCKPYPDAYDEFLQAQRNNNPALILTLVGAVMIGYTGIKWLMGDDLQWYYAAGGAVMIGASIPLYIGTRNHSINAAQIYNYEVKSRYKTGR